MHRIIQRRDTEGFGGSGAWEEGEEWYEKASAEAALVECGT